MDKENSQKILNAQRKNDSAMSYIFKSALLSLFLGLFIVKTLLENLFSYFTTSRIINQLMFNGSQSFKPSTAQQFLNSISLITFLIKHIDFLLYFQFNLLPYAIKWIKKDEEEHMFDHCLIFMIPKC